VAKKAVTAKKPARAPAKKKRGRRLGLLSALVPASKLLVHTVGGTAFASGLSKPRTCSIVGFQGFHPTNCAVLANLYGPFAGTPIAVPAAVANFRWQADLTSSIPAGDYMVEIVATVLGSTMDSLTFTLTLS
jgi:hypothetical protein